MDLNGILASAMQSKASDIHLKVGQPPVFRIDGELESVAGGVRITTAMIEDYCSKIMNTYQREQFTRANEADLAYGVPGLGRFRVNAYSQRGTTSLAFRPIPMDIKGIDDLNLPPVLKELVLTQRGLILVTGATGMGKSTTLASMIEHLNAQRKALVVTIEDPIEFLFRDNKSIINQREVGSDTRNFHRALKSALRQDPDVIMVGEMRDRETIETALLAAETGHLVLSTLHTVDATETINRIISVFPQLHQKQIRIQLAAVLKAVVSLRLVPRADGNGRVPAVEVMINTNRIKQLIEDADQTKQIHETIQQGVENYSMQTFDQSLMALVKKELITVEEASRQATNPNDLNLKLSGVYSTSNSSWAAFEK